MSSPEVGIVGATLLRGWWEGETHYSYDDDGDEYVEMTSAHFYSADWSGVPVCGSSMERVELEGAYRGPTPPKDDARPSIDLSRTENQACPKCVEIVMGAVRP